MKVTFFTNFQGLSVAKNFQRPETAPLNTLAIKRGLLCNFTKILKGTHFMGNSCTGLKFSITIDYYCKSSKHSSYSLLKNMSKIAMSDLNKRSLFC